MLMPYKLASSASSLLSLCRILSKLLACLIIHQQETTLTAKDATSAKMCSTSVTICMLASVVDQLNTLAAKIFIGCKLSFIW